MKHRNDLHKDTQERKFAKMKKIGYYGQNPYVPDHPYFSRPHLLPFSDKSYLF
jgi:hypothetical protein